MADLQVLACDDLMGWTTDANLTDAVDGADFQEGAGSIAGTSVGSGWGSDVYLKAAGSWDWSGYTYGKIWIKSVNSRTMRIAFRDSDGDREYWDVSPGNVWTDQQFTFGTGTTIGTPDYTKMNRVLVYINASAGGQVIKWDDIRVGPLPAGGVQGSSGGAVASMMADSRMFLRCNPYGLKV